MYAIIADGGRQLKVEEGQQLLIDYRDLSAGEAVVFDQVLAYRDDAGLRLGKPTLPGARVSAEVVGVKQGEKISVQKFMRFTAFRRKTGHRQLHTEVKINKIEVA